MQKQIVQNSRVYNKIWKYSWYNENKLEKKILDHFRNIYRDFWIVPFKTDVTDGSSTKRPDLAIISKSTAKWWVVEVELETHSFSDVYNQVIVFQRGKYSQVHLNDVLKKLSYYKFNRKEELHVKRTILDVQPDILVIVDAFKPDWYGKLGDMNVGYATFELYKGAYPIEAYRLKGDYPKIYLENATTCKPVFDRSMLQILHDTKITNFSSDLIEVWIDGEGVLEFYYYREDDKKYLRPVSYLPLEDGDLWRLDKTSEGTFELRKI